MGAYLLLMAVHLPWLYNGHSTCRGYIPAMTNLTRPTMATSHPDGFAANPYPNPNQVGIGNTTAAAALLAALTGAEPEDCCGRGTGLDAAGLALCGNTKHGRHAAGPPPEAICQPAEVGRGWRPP